MNNFNLKYRKVFRVYSTSFLMKGYKFLFDNKSLANPKISGFLKPLSLLIKFLLPKLKSKIKFGIYFNDKWKIVYGDGSNTQYHALYFDKFKNGYELEIMSMLDILLGPDDVFYDIGSNWGYFSLYVLSKKGYKGTVYSFDPQPDICRDLLGIKNQLFVGNLEIINIGLSDFKNDYADFSSPDDFHSGLFQIKDGVGKYKIDTLDSLTINQPNVIKIDVEGMEENVIKGGKGLINKSKPYLLIENPKNNRSSLIDTLKSYDYSIFGLYINESEENNVQITLNEYNVNSIEKNLIAIHNSNKDHFLNILRKTVVNR